MPKQIRAIGSFNVSGCNLTHVPDTLRLMQRKDQLRVIDMSSNQIDQLPGDSFLGCSNLKVLRLNDNVLTALQAETLDGTLVEKLFLGQNLLTAIPDLRDLCSALKVLDLNDNKILHISNLFISNCEMLEVLDLGNNFIRRVSSNWFNTHSLRFLNISFNDIVEMACVETSLIPPFRNLVQIDLSRNAFRYLPNLTSSRSSLTVLNMNNNEYPLIQSLSNVNLLPLSKLKHLELSGNKINYWPNITGNHLEYLLLDNNAISDPPQQEIMDALCELKVLTLHNNRFLTLPDLPAILPNLKSLSLHNNPWTCDCAHVWIYMLNEFGNPPLVLNCEVSFACEPQNNRFKKCAPFEVSHNKKAHMCQSTTGMFNFVFQ